MSEAPKRVPVPGSAREKLPVAQEIGEVPAGEFSVTFTVRRRKELPSLEEQAMLLPAERSYLSREEHAKEYGADPADIKKVEDFARANGLTVVNSDAARRTVMVTGTAETYAKALGVDLKMYQAGGTRYRGREGDILIPAELDGIVTSVTGLDNRPAAKPRS
jgi:kumamolisin